MSDDTKQNGGGKKPKKYARINFRLTDDERTKIETEAAAYGLTPGGYLRWLAFKHPQTRAVRRLLPDVKLLAQIKAEAGRVDGNIAQLLRLANRGDLVVPEEIYHAAKAVRDFYIYAMTLLKGYR